MGKRVIEVLFCNFCGRDVEGVESLQLLLGRDQGDFDLCPECADLFREKFFNAVEEEDVVGEPEEEYEDEEDGFGTILGQSEEEEEEDEYDFDEEDEEPAPSPRKKVSKKRKKVVKKTPPQDSKKKVRKKKVRYQADPLRGINHKEQDGTTISASGVVREGKVLQKIKKAAVSERRGVIKKCPNGECEYDEDTHRCDICGLKQGQSGIEPGAQKAHDPIKANAEGQKEMGFDPYMGVHTFPVDVNSGQVRKKMKKNLLKQNEAVVKKYGKSNRYFNFNPSDGDGSRRR